MARRHEARVDWKHLAVYGAVVAVVAMVGLLAIWSFIERQSLVITPDPLPKVTIVTQDARSPLAAAWVRLLTKAELTPTLVPLEKFDPIEGVVVFCDVPQVSPKLGELLYEFVHRGGAIVFAGMPPQTPIGPVRLTAEVGDSDPAMRLSESVSPLLARLNPGYELQVRPSKVALLKESPRMVVDARWRQNSRAVVMHMEHDGARFVWFGLDPNALLHDDDRQLLLLLRTAFRWVSGQPVSDGAVGPVAQEAATLTPEARREARAERFAFSVDRMSNQRMFSVRMTNRGKVPLENPTVKIWLPPRVTQVALAGDFIMKRGATLTGVPEEGACVVALPSLTRNEDRVMKIRIVEQRNVAGRRVAAR
jgi:hypothetical protein